MGDPFIEVATVQELQDTAVQIERDAKVLALWAQDASRLYDSLRALVTAGELSLTDAAQQARAKLDERNDPLPAVVSGSAAGEQPVKPARKTRSDQGVPRGPRKATSPGMEDPYLVDLRKALADGPLTEAGLLASGVPADLIASAIKAGAVVRWTGQREGDKEPVSLIGTPAQRTAMPCDDAVPAE